MKMEKMENGEGLIFCTKLQMFQYSICKFNQNIKQYVQVMH